MWPTATSGAVEISFNGWPVVGSATVTIVDNRTYGATTLSTYYDERFRVAEREVYEWPTPRRKAYFDTLSKELAAARYWSVGQSRRLATAPAELPRAPLLPDPPRRVHGAPRRALRAFTTRVWPRLRARRRKSRNPSFNLG